MFQTQPVTPLRRRMLDDMKLRNLAAGTRRIYVHSVAGFSAFHGRSPDELTLEDVRDYQLHLVARGLKASTICQVTSALSFLYAVTLDQPEQAARIPLPRKADPLPAILSRAEVARLLGAVADRRSVGRASPGASLRGIYSCSGPVQVGRDLLGDHVLALGVEPWTRRGAARAGSGATCSSA